MDGTESRTKDYSPKKDGKDKVAKKVNNANVRRKNGAKRVKDVPAEHA